LPDEEVLLIAAVSGRALAAAAARAGFRPRVMDFFDDLDTRSLTTNKVALCDAERGFSTDDLVAGFRHLAGAERPLGLVYGAGFEDRPQILHALAQHWPIFGNPAEVVARAKNPREIARLCASLGIPHPEISYDLPADLDHWLIKHEGGGGGDHVVPARERTLAVGDYYQRYVAGTQVSVLLLADGRKAETLGLSAQWTASSAAHAFQFGGAVRPAFPTPACSQQLCDAALNIAAAFTLRGLNSIDFLVEDEMFHLIEINPRPGATVDIFEDVDGRLLHAHVEACRGFLPREPLVFAQARASTIAFAREELISMPQLEWPAWCSDRQKTGTHVARGEPICTIFADAEEPSVARQRVADRLDDFLRHVALEASKVSAT
jgi:predicted ATP-grasp superfamily ATP-dependent carboligase